ASPATGAAAHRPRVRRGDPVLARRGARAGGRSLHAGTMVVSMADFKASLSNATPADGLKPPLAALWWAAKGNWDTAHKIVQDESDTNSAWVQPYLHRVERHLSDADYRYPLSGK